MVVGIIMMITFCFAVGDNLEAILGSYTGIPVIQLVYNVTNSIPGTMVMSMVLLILNFFATITTIASSSRQTWAFARDKGFPFSGWLSQVRPGQDIPLNSLTLCLVITLALGAINFGSEAALDAIMSASNSALLISYIICIGCVRLKRFRKEPLLPRTWDLGRWGAPINDTALAYLFVAFVFSFFPTDVNPDAPDMNWSIVIFVGVGIIAAAYYWLGGKDKYISPKTIVKDI